MNLTPQTKLTRRLWLALCSALAVAMAPSGWSQAAATATPATTAAETEAAKAAAEAKKDDKLVLSPFVVTTTKDSGYFAENTLAGSRLNSNLADLAASITVVTKQQLEDTGSLDINDVFLYEANTEGASSYTPVAMNRNNLTDNIGGYSADDGTSYGIATANRVRGLGRVDTAQNNYPTIARLAFDSYNTNSVEISRGPNSMLFGTGAPSGIVNQSSASAVLGQQRTSLSLRGGSFDAWRVSLNSNIPIGDKLAIFLAGVYDSRGFERKPSSDVYRRQYGAITWQPWRKTMLTASIENYTNYNNRPNYLPPQDRVTDWLGSGKPGWNPSTQVVTFANGSTSVPYLTSSLDARFIAGNPSAQSALTNVPTATAPNPFFIAGMGFPSGRQIIMIGPDGKDVTMWVHAGLSGGALPASPTQAQRVVAATNLTAPPAKLTPTPPTSTGATNYGVWVLPHLTDQSIYDWTKYNISGANYGTQSGHVMNVELQQQILPNLNFSAGWFRQTFEEYTHYGLGQANQAPRLYVDTNTHYMDGTPNPYFGSPFVLDMQADTFYLPESNDNYRAMLSYELDMTDKQGWMRWLGRHRFLGLVSLQDQWKNNLRYRHSYQGGDARFLPTAANLALNTATRQSWGLNAANIQRWYYVGQNPNGVVTSGITVHGDPGYGGPTHSTLHFYDWNTNAYSTAEMTYDMNLIYAGGNYGVATRKTKSKSFAWQGYLWDERILPTMGWRTDNVTLASYGGRDASGALLTNQQFYTNGEGVEGLWGILGAEREFIGKTKTRGAVVRLFKGWNGIEHKANEGNFLASALRSLSFHYNESDNVNPPAGIQVDFFNNILPAPSGTGKDYGFGLNLFDNKLVVRLNWYEATNLNALSTAANVVVGRLQRIDTTGGKRWAEYVVRIRNGQNPATDLEFHNNTANPLTAAELDQIDALQWGSFDLGTVDWPNEYRSGATINSTENNNSKGKELQLTYNPTRSWTIKWTVGQQQAQYRDAGPEVKAWIAYRKPQWMALTAPDLPNEIIKANGNRLKLTTFWDGYGFTEGASFNDAPSNSAGGTGSMNATYIAIVDAVVFPMIALENTKSSNLREWSTTVLSSYSFQKGWLKGFSFGGSYRWQDKATAGYQSLLDPTTYARPSATVANIVFPDLTKPITTPALTNVDLWASYTRKVWSDKVRMKVQLNVRDVTQSGGLQAVVYNQDGNPAQYRILDPRTWFVTTTFDF